MTLDTADLARLAQEMVDLAVGHGDWNGALDRLNVTLGADAATIELADLRTGAVAPLGHGLDRAALAEYTDRIFAINPRVKRPDIQPLAVYSQRHIPADVAAVAGEFDDWISRHRLCPHWLGSVILADAGLVAFTSLQASADRGAFALETEAALAMVLPALTACLQVERALGRRGIDAAALEQGLGGDGVQHHCLVDAAGHVAHASPGFLAMAQRNGAIDIIGGRVVAQREADRKALEAMLAAMLAGNLVAPPPLRIAPIVPGKGVLLRAVRLNEARSLFDRIRPRVLLLATDLDAPARGVEAALRAGWGLTAREAELCQLLGEGQPLAAAAARMGVTEQTARTHLKNAFRRLEIERQTDLVRLVARIGG
ncbi:response regulator transcription factor [Novosphingobium cyanobacteriorum]|uniref:Helix-turn-helix transcriptional regulator n=1 Tax=Novosphingobium cyanobacteriorum TaxID=3024215 RepID=A0ABT6CIB0_9SPHN|nr:helix-turn-helix transcriptional regulator [Novosphingobium cyanobacteriorum]MDF8333552.1 helix-turn-helix transcriptional regulator [Novosphingobium cyanobacteriorum]